MFKIVAVFAVLALAKAVPMGRATGKLDTTGVDAPDETVKAFSKGLFESCAAVREAGACSHPMAAKHCAATCDAAKKLVAGTAVTSADKVMPCAASGGRAATSATPAHARAFAAPRAPSDERAAGVPSRVSCASL